MFVLLLCNVCSSVNDIWVKLITEVVVPCHFFLNYFRASSKHISVVWVKCWIRFHVNVGFYVQIKFGFQSFLWLLSCSSNPLSTRACIIKERSSMIITVTSKREYSFFWFWSCWTWSLWTIFVCWISAAWISFSGFLSCIYPWASWWASIVLDLTFLMLTMLNIQLCWMDWINNFFFKWSIWTSSWAVWISWIGTAWISLRWFLDSIDPWSVWRGVILKLTLLMLAIFEIIFGWSDVEHNFLWLRCTRSWCLRAIFVSWISAAWISFWRFLYSIHPLSSWASVLLNLTFFVFTIFYIISCCNKWINNFHCSWFWLLIPWTIFVSWISTAWIASWGSLNGIYPFSTWSGVILNLSFLMFTIFKVILGRSHIKNNFFWFRCTRAWFLRANRISWIGTAWISLRWFLDSIDPWSVWRGVILKLTLLMLAIFEIIFGWSDVEHNFLWLRCTRSWCLRAIFVSWISAAWISFWRFLNSISPFSRWSGVILKNSFLVFSFSNIFLCWINWINNLFVFRNLSPALISWVSTANWIRLSFDHDSCSFWWTGSFSLCFWFCFSFRFCFSFLLLLSLLRFDFFLCFFFCFWFRLFFSFFLFLLFCGSLLTCNFLNFFISILFEFFILIFERCHVFSLFTSLFFGYWQLSLVKELLCFFFMFLSVQNILINAKIWNKIIFLISIRFWEKILGASSTTAHWIRLCLGKTFWCSLLYLDSSLLWWDPASIISVVWVPSSNNFWISFRWLFYLSLY